MRRIAIALCATALLLCAFAPVATAAGRIDGTVVECTSPAPNVTDIVKFWDAGVTEHMRGWTASYEATGDPLCAGTVDVVAIIQMSPTGIGGLQGTVVYHLSGIDGGWIATFEQQWAFGRGQLTIGREVARGFGALEGWHLKAVLNEYFDGTIVETDTVFAPHG